MAVKETAGNAIGKGKAGPGRPKGIPNKTTTALKEMILAALDNNGGVEYLSEQARENPTSFLTLIGKVLPLTIAGSGENGEHVIHVVRWVDE